MVPKSFLRFTTTEDVQKIHGNDFVVQVAKFRRWYYTAEEWIQYEEFGDLEERGQ